MNEGKRTWREAQAERATAEAEAQWGMQVWPDERQANIYDLAQQAYERGDALFRVDIPEFWVQGRAFAGTTASRVRRAEYADVLGAIERMGWHLEHVAATYVLNGSSATKRMGHSVGSTYVADNRIFVGLYVFRRRSS